MAKEPLAADPLSPRLTFESPLRVARLAFESADIGQIPPPRAAPEIELRNMEANFSEGDCGWLGGFGRQAGSRAYSLRFEAMALG